MDVGRGDANHDDGDNSTIEHLQRALSHTIVILIGVGGPLHCTTTRAIILGGERDRNNTEQTQDTDTAGGISQRSR